MVGDKLAVTASPGGVRCQPQAPFQSSRTASSRRDRLIGGAQRM
jgi:hypothetical protein